MARRLQEKRCIQALNSRQKNIQTLVFLVFKGAVRLFFAMRAE
ncbi:NUDIX domain-containing protein [Acetobacter orientalis]|uniref:NUDIX domain-containing protein n=1 Tax=Acetobacter orientalis TaxID=146474 RepID=A0A2Z5ZIE3_9PROT|nr:NUDIX domain-containing protein [Acetobacter orientalis]